MRRIEAICQRHQVDLTTAALQFPLAHPRLAAIVVGALTPAEVDDNIQRLAVSIPAELWRELKHEQLMAESVPVPA